ncbi:MAG TPA: hypothetical protein DDZ81_00590 [Acetobacteraceae bacterium]|jgi:membrane fusion protein, heavy metal efflux system|nr:hypothetical protein [Acetobacteraceae bacterium]
MNMEAAAAGRTLPRIPGETRTGRRTVARRAMRLVRAISSIIMLALWLAPSADAATEAINLTEAQLATLDVRMETPRPTTEIPLPDAPARIEVPPQAERVVGAPRAGLITQLRATEGETVEPGQTLAVIQSPDILTLQRDYLDALSAYRLARTQYERDQALYKDGSIAQRRMQETEHTFAERNNGMTAARHMLRGGGFTAAEIATLDAGGQMLPTLDIRAPIGGVVLTRMVSAGDRVDDRQPLYKIADLSTLWGNVSLPAEALLGARIGLPVTISGCAVPGRVVVVGAVVDPTSQTVMLRAALDKPCPQIRPGQMVQAQVYVHHDGTVMMVPRTAVVANGGKDWVFVRQGKGYAAQAVTIAARANDAVYIASGLDAQTQVAVSAIATLKAAWVGMGVD